MIRANALRVEAKDPTGIDVLIDPDGTVRWRMDDEEWRRYRLARRRIHAGRGDEHTTLGEGLAVPGWLRAWFMRLVCIYLSVVDARPPPRWMRAIPEAMAEVERLKEERER